MNFVERNANRGFGQPVIIGRRLTVFNIVSHANYEENIVDFLKDFDLSMDELRSAVSYCRNKQCREIKNSTDHYCDGCILRSISEGWKSIKDDFTEIDGMSYSNDGKTIYFGTVDQLEDAEFGLMGWLLAEKVEKRLP